MFKKLMLLVLMALALNSCKKEFVTSSIQKTEHNLPLKKISYSQFLSAINLQKTGILQTPLLNARTNNKLTHSIVTSNQFGFQIDTSKVIKITLGDTTCYVMALMPTAIRATNFENLTIQVNGTKTTAFLATYVPTKEWIVAYRQKKPTIFDGATYISKILIDGLNSSEIHGTGDTKTMSSKDARTMTIGETRVQLAPGECEVYDVIEIVPYGCSDGNHYPGFCPWEGGSTAGWDPDEDWLPGYTNLRYTVVNCAPFEYIPPSGGGGGVTTPNPPGGYDPCDCNAPPVAVSSTNAVEATRSMVAQGNCCDGNQLPPLPPQRPYQIQTLINALNLSGSNLVYVDNNFSFGNELYQLLEEDGYTNEGRIAALLTIEAAKTVTYSSDYNTYYAATWANIDGFYPYDPQTFGIYYTMQCVAIRMMHPEYSTLRVHWEASKEMLHLALDGVGLAPGFGEIADITNGIIYTIEGRGTDATLSYASAIPFGGWFAAGAKFARRTITVTSTTKVAVKWSRVAGDIISFWE